MRTERWIKTLRSEMLAKVDHSGCLICWNGMPYHVTRIIHHFNYHGSSGLVLRWFMFHQLHKRYMYIIQKWFFGVVSCCFQVSGLQLHVSCIIYLHSSFFSLSQFAFLLFFWVIEQCDSTAQMQLNQLALFSFGSTDIDQCCFSNCNFWNYPSRELAKLLKPEIIGRNRPCRRLGYQ